MIFFTGFLVGIVSLIPGISGGTILMLMKKYETISYAITHFKEKESYPILFFLVLGIFLGTITFARIIELCFFFFPQATFLLFSGFVLFSLPNLIKSENIKLNKSFFFLGMSIIYLLSFFSFQTTTVVLDYPKITLLFLFLFCFYGTIDGFFTILPGISGSMVMMILGPYFLYKSYLANLSIETLSFFIPLLFYFIGDFLGFFLGSKVSLYFLNKKRKLFLSFLFGMVFMSAILIFPFQIFQSKALLIYVALLIVSFLIVQLLNAFN